MTPAEPPPRYRITVVCLGNICRSPIGEAVLAAKLRTAGLDDRVVVDSAGTGDWHLGHPMDRRAAKVLDDHGYARNLDHVARQIGPPWFAGIDLVLAMDATNYRDLRSMMASVDASARLRMMRSFDPALAGRSEPHRDLDVPDPYYGGAEGFDEVLAVIERAADALVVDLAAGLSRPSDAGR